MSNVPSARSRAQSHFRSSDQRTDTVRAEIEKERAALDAKTARLKALRLAKEAEARIDADAPVEKPKKKSASPAKGRP